MRKSPSGSVQAQRDRKKAYREQAGPVSNPGDGRARAAERRKNAERRVAKRMARLTNTLQALKDSVSTEAL